MRAAFWTLCAAGVLLSHGALAGQGSVRALLRPLRHVVLSTQVGGRIARMPVAEGDRFAKGQLLARIDCTRQRAALQKSEAQVASARDRVAAQHRLVALDSGSRLDLELATDNLAKAKADRRMARATLDDCAIKAPYGGRVVQWRAQPQQTVAAGAPVIEILDDRALEVQMIVPSNWLNWLKVGAPFRLQLDETGGHYRGHVTKLAARIDPASQSLEIRGRIDGDPPGLLAGMSGMARFRGAATAGTAPAVAGRGKATPAP